MSGVNDVRVAAQSLYNNTPNMNTRGPYSSIDITRSHSVNLITEDFVAGYMQDGRMSVVRRFFCLFVTFDLVFISLLWLICIMVTYGNIYDAFKHQVFDYAIKDSLFDIVMAAICRFTVLLLFYALLYINHWIIIALSTSGSCMFLICKVFYYDWQAIPQPVFQVVLIVISFVLAWGEAWFLDCRVIPQERHASSYFSGQVTDRSPLMAPFLSSMPPESVANFYSPFETTHNSDDDDDEQEDEYRRMGAECVRRAYDLLQSPNWKIEKITDKNDTIQSMQVDKVGKVYRLTGRVKFPPKMLLEELFYKIEDVPKWNPTLLESKIVRKIDSHTDISYTVAAGGPGGKVVKSRDFVNLRCWHLCRDGKVIEDSDEEEEEANGMQSSIGGTGSVSTVSDDDYFNPLVNPERMTKSASVGGIEKDLQGSQTSGSFNTLSKSLNAKAFYDSQDPSLADDEFSDARSQSVENLTKTVNISERLYISAAISIEYLSVPANPKYTRGQNLVSCWAMREIEGKPDACIFEWLMCLDLKVYIPKFVLETVYTTLMQDYMTYLRQHCKELRRRKKMPERVAV